MWSALGTRPMPTLNARSHQRLVAESSLTPEDRAPNVLLVVPEDDGVFLPLETVGNLQVVSRPQVYLDLLASPRGESLGEDFLAHMPWRS